MTLRDDGRGQLLMIIALLLAVTLVALALVLNAAIFTENLSTRESVGSGGSTTDTVDPGTTIADIYERTNENETRTTVDANTSFNESFEAWVDERTASAARDGAIFEADWTTHAGWRLEQDTDRSFAPGDDPDAVEWTLASDARNVSTLEMNVTRADLFDGTAGLADVEDDAFRLNVSDGSSTWELYVFRDTSNSTIVVYDGEPTAETDLGGLLDSPDSCTRATDRAVVDVRNGTFGGTDCGALGVPSSMSGPLEVGYENVRGSVGGAERVNGTYTVVVNGSDAIATNGSDHPSRFNVSGKRAPTATAVVYAVEYDTYYEEADIVHDHEGRYAPREEVR